MTGINRRIGDPSWQGNTLTSPNKKWLEFRYTYTRKSDRTNKEVPFRWEERLLRRSGNVRREEVTLYKTTRSSSRKDLWPFRTVKKRLVTEKRFEKGVHRTCLCFPSFFHNLNKSYFSLIMKCISCRNKIKIVTWNFRNFCKRVLTLWQSSYTNTGGGLKGLTTVCLAIVEWESFTSHTKSK